MTKRNGKFRRMLFEKTFYVTVPSYVSISEEVVPCHVQSFYASIVLEERHEKLFNR